jgi:hypothetical protein
MAADGLGDLAALLGAVAVYLWLAGLQAHHAYAAVTACRPAGSLTCGAISSSFNDTSGPTSEAVAALLQVVPALIGAFAGATVLARELETGTFRYTWTQGWDPVTGWGSPDAQYLVPLLAHAARSAS